MKRGVTFARIFQKEKSGFRKSGTNTTVKRKAIHGRTEHTGSSSDEKRRSGRADCRYFRGSGRIPEPVDTRNHRTVLSADPHGFSRLEPGSEI
jgi:hypothetical protein